MKKYFAEFLGTLVLVLIGCGTAVFSGVDLVATSLAFGLSVVAMAYTIGGFSGCHINPAITLAAWVSKRISSLDALMYMVFQVAGAIAGAAILYYLAPESGLGANGLQEGISVEQGLIAEGVFTFIFVLVVLATTDAERGAGERAGFFIGLTLVLVHLVCIGITGTSVNPARSIGPALLAGGAALEQLWIFVVAPFVGALLSALVWKCFTSCCCKKK
ncbi:MAG: MIP family channel protein [Alistipes sp.]|nr:MIP family channel protein [Alistipes sp.]MBQ8774604.1 MIP family channel protein [Alistipes sp.]